MKHISKKDEALYIYSMGKKLKVTSLFTDVNECNEHCSKTDDAVIAQFGTFIICANKYDKGI